MYTPDLLNSFIFLCCLSLEKVDAYTVELQNSESRVAKLRDEGERLHLPYVLLQEVYKLEVRLSRTYSIHKLL